MKAISRSRWAAIGAAIAVTLGAGGIGISHATSDSGDGPVSAFFPIEPCRLADTRPAPDTVGSRTTGIGPGETYTLDGWGTLGDCTLPSDITGLVLNVTAVGASQQTNLRFFPQGANLPTAANLNPTPGAPPTPNAVNVGLNASNGKFSVYNAFGVVAVIIDVVGYYDDHTHDDRYPARLFATIDSSGDVFRGAEGLVSSTRNSTGNYTLTFDRDVSQCAVATSDLVFTGTRDVSAEAGFGGAERVGVRVTNSSNALEDTFFNVIVMC